MSLYLRSKSIQTWGLGMTLMTDTEGKTMRVCMGGRLSGKGKRLV